MALLSAITLSEMLRNVEQLMPEISTECLSRESTNRFQWHWKCYQNTRAESTIGCPVTSGPPENCRTLRDECVALTDNESHSFGTSKQCKFEQP